MISDNGIDGWTQELLNDSSAHQLTSTTSQKPSPIITCTHIFTSSLTEIRRTDEVDFIWIEVFDDQEF